MSSGLFIGFRWALVVAVADPELIQQILRNRPKLYRHLGTIELVTNTGKLMIRVKDVE
jgi:hypothetical protein